MPKFADLNLSKNTETTEILINDIPVHVKHTIPISDKIDLIQVALQKSEENGVFNEVKKDIYFHLNLIYLYTDIEFSDEDKADEMELYDKLDQNGVIEKVIKTLITTEAKQIGKYSYLDEEGEYVELRDYFNECADSLNEYRNTAAAVINRIITDLPANAAAAKEIVDSFDRDKYAEVVNFAEAANGGRNINTQTVPIRPAASDKQ